MPFLPIAERELRVASRRPSTYRMRAMAVFTGIIVLAWTLLDLARKGIPASEQGPKLFMVLSIATLIYAILAGALVTSDCLSAEKRDGTLGLLFLTDLKGYDVVFGKLAASSLNSIFALVGIVPLLAISLLLGGVSATQFILAALSLFSALFLSLSTGIFVSAYNNHERKAIFFTIVLLSALTFGPFAIVLGLSAVSISDQLMVFILSPSPMLPLILQLSKPPFPILPPFCFSLLFQFSVGLIFLRLASRKLPQSWQEKPAKKSALRKRTPAVSKEFSEKIKTFRSALLDRNPFLWLAMRTPEKIQHVWLFVGSMGAIWLMSFSYDRSIAFDGLLALFWILFTNTFLKIWLAYETANRVSEDRKIGALELMLSTPLNENEIIKGQWLALRRQFFKPLLAVLLWECFIVFNLDQPELRSPYFAGVFLLSADYFALGWVSLWLGMTSTGLNRAVMKTIFLVMTLPWIIFSGWLLLLYRSPGNSSLSQNDGATIWLVISLVLNAILIFGWAKPRLLSQFRNAAAQPFLTKSK